ncbi:unnamed protein product [Knipowitschia caucasica]|uniref:Lysosome-associated membrane glycoprotein 1 n=2 Tax=Knipowitschia caucasica TaxID=637954 RepID=A0AAV2KU04_KNICA
MPPTPTQPPTKSNSTVGNYTLNNGTQRCLMVQMELKIRLVSLKANGTFLLLPNKTSTAGNCYDNNATLVLISKELNITFVFSKNATSNKTMVKKVNFTLTYDFNKKSNDAVTYNVANDSLKMFETKFGHSHSCSKESISVGQGFYLDLSHDRNQAFNFPKTNKFGPADYCSADQSNYRVAIAVGITLLVLVVVVVIAYLLARRKRNNGYQSL